MLPRWESRPADCRARLSLGFGEIESVKAVSDLNSPVTGEVVEANEALQDELSTINKDPYGNGWLVKIKLAGEPSGLMNAEEYEQHVAATS